MAIPSYDPATGDDVGALQFIEDVTQDAASVQKSVLADILSQNSGTEYLKRFGVDGGTDPETFKAKVPVISYENIQADVQRIVNGDRSPIFSSHPVSEFLTSSGTSGGERKLMPTIDAEMDRRHLLFSLLMPLIKQTVRDLDEWKALRFLFIKSETKTAGGIVARPASTSYYTSEQFKKRPFETYTSPNEIIECTDSFQSMYTQMLCGLVMRHQVQRVGAIFASGFLRALNFLKNNYQQLAHDISTGTLTPQITDPSIRKCLAQKNILKPDQELADFIIQECSKQNWEKIITKIWPNAKYVDVIVTGAMAQYIPTIDLYSGGLPIVCTMYASSECFFGPNLKPFCDPSEVSYLILPNMGYFEFLPLNDSSSSPSPSLPVDLTEVELGKEYELVITTYAGLCRYRVGDVLKVTGFHNSAPEFRFVGRRNVLLSIDLDKTDETELQKAVDNAKTLLVQECNTSVVEYTSYADTKSLPGHYVIYFELLSQDRAVRPDDETLNRCCFIMEESLNAMYRQGRTVDRSIGPLEIRVVKNGTFEEIMDFAISRGASISQYKAPRCVSSPPILEILDSRVVSTHFSPSLPHWAPAGGRK